MRSRLRLQHRNGTPWDRARRCGAAPAVAILFLARHGLTASEGPSACHGPRIVVATPLSEAWTRAVDDARASLHQQTNLDRCAEVRLEPDQRWLRVLVSLEDGRSATREVQRADGLLPTLEGLLGLPPPEAQPQVDERWREPVTDHEGARQHPTTAATATPRLEVGLGAMGRVAGKPLYVGLGLAAFAQLNLRRWLFGVVARWDAVDALVTEAAPSGFNMQTLAIGVNAGVRSSFRGVALDALFGPQMRVENQEAFGGPTAPDGIGGATSDVRLDLTLRVSAPPGSGVRFFGEGDIDGSPARLSKIHRLDPQLPALPSWSGGLTLGAFWSLP